MIQQRNIGKSDLRVSSIGLSCNNFGRSLDLAWNVRAAGSMLSREDMAEIGKLCVEPA